MKDRPKLRKVLVANRGEIAVRIIRTLRALGLQTAAVYSDADRGALHVRLADEAARIGAPPAAESYLRIEALLEAARALKADAVHPGYGFLSERESFARAVEAAGLTFIGPTPANIASLGDKRSSGSALRAAGIPPVPGSHGAVGESRLGRLAEEIGFPLLLKAAAGGGGRGIRIVRHQGELASAFALAASEAQSAFGSSELVAERYLERARHVEVQVLGDGEGGVRLFCERDCSTQRRLQKVLEETPSPAVTPALREKLLLAAGRAMSMARYRGAGTLEFLLTEDGELYFLEMNTRLQVEHPITEMTTGVDLVAEQLALAAGERLPPWRDRLEEALVESRGAALEFRVNAEDPQQDFQPSTGKVTALRWAGGPRVRIDAALEVGTVVTPYYDSLLAKVIAWGEGRAEAVERLAGALRESHVGGLITTLPLGLAILADPPFRAGKNHCQYLGDRLRQGDFFPRPPAREDLPLLAAAAALAQSAARREQSGRQPRRATGEAGPLSPWVQVERLRLSRGPGATGRWEGEP